MDLGGAGGATPANPFEALRRGLAGVEARRLRDLETLSGGGSVVRPSDDPRRAIRLSDLSTTIARSNDGIDGIDRGVGLVDLADIALRRIRGALTDGLGAVDAAEGAPVSGADFRAIGLRLKAALLSIDDTAAGTRLAGVQPLVNDAALGQTGSVTVATHLPAGEIPLPFRSDFRTAALLGGGALDLGTPAGRTAARAAFESALSRTDATLAAAGGAARRLLQARETHQVQRSAALTEASALGNTDFARAIADLRLSDLQKRGLGEIARRTLGTSLFDFLA